ncbi:polygalacturonase 1 beta-like protein 3 [Ricinus communis]|uniref:Polygalacturonase-1 non-catalytic subunit beta, putative n=1 Tax=Ricinus communis TaxID=3988 RepID=B9SHB4_RICCO|nr:polygalacturonase 1 beta-like protein 3 [Ricinus communis]XP_025014258.1 polygalacturonase 1 beta-like protein 3 [Ricinus communis]EEF37021.1 Polygalacturonase-1 non-catalytic subunit beta precursor, putative [Ricinus communis]|eukprot:XP_002525383.1 polygalacturonase 1 beta-like protein 3 [Ricinus communis]
MQTHPITSFFFLIFLCFPFLLNVALAGGRGLLSEESPLSPKASLIRYWNKEIHNNLPKSQFILSKASPLNVIEAATFSKLAAQNALSTKLPAFCSSAKLLCFPDLSPSLEKHDRDTNFANYLNKNFTNYGNEMAGGVNAFKNYSDNDNLPVDSFRRYGRGGAGRDEKFSNYAPGGNVIDESFSGYGTSGTGGKSDFKNYAEQVNVPNLVFTSYSDAANGKQQSFTRYSGDTNSGNEKFTSYGKNGNGVPTNFKGYGENSNVIGSDFNNYGETANAEFDNFTSYGFNGNVPENKFKNYGAGGNGGGSGFTSYRDQSNVGDDSFQSYAKESNGQEVNFNNYGKSFNEGTDTFKGYGQGANAHKIGFKMYGVNNTFKEYAKLGVSFAKYTNITATPSAETTAMKASGSLVNRWVEPGKFFRESKLKKGTVMPMPDIRDKMPKRSFLPRSITSKLPFSTSNFAQLKQTFHAFDNSTMETLMLDALTECERAPSPGETKRCIGSAEDLIDFATSVLGRNVVARTTANVNGSKKNIKIGSIKGINGGKVTESVSCHQSLYPYLLYYCHSVPKVRVYEADILDPNSNSKINHGVAICHLDTSSWSPTHGAFVALGSGPGRIEVCHWIFENDLTWTTAD